MLTSNRLTAQEAKEYHICIEDYIRKPFQEQDLFNAINQILSRKKVFQDSLALAKEAGVDKEKFCQFAALSRRVSANKKIISILQKPEEGQPVSLEYDPETTTFISEMIRVTRANEIQVEELREEIQTAFMRKGYAPPS